MNILLTPVIPLLLMCTPPGASRNPPAKAGAAWDKTGPSPAPPASAIARDSAATVLPDAAEIFPSDFGF
jgi:hypothetical protein